MKKILLFILILLAGNTVFAQDYAPLPDTGIRRYFTNSAGYLRGIRVDSVVQEVGYKRYVTFRTARGWKPGTQNQELADPNGACWIGKNVRAYVNGDWHFPNVAGDTILVKTGAKTGDTWIFHRDTSALWTEANVLSIDTQTVFGVLDSVKRIGLTVKSGGTVLPNSFMSTFEIVLSKTHGFAQVPDLYLFPYRDFDPGYNERDYWYRNLTSPNFNGAISALVLMFRNVINWNMSEREIYDLKVGDIIFNKSVDNFGPYDNSILDTIILRQDFPTYTDYGYNRWLWRRSTNQGGPTLTVQHGSVTARFTNKLLFDTTYMPEEYYGNCNRTYIFENDSSLCSRGLLIDLTVGFGCGLYVGGLQYPKSYKYKKGLGLVYFSEGDGDGRRRQDDLYSYQKNGVTCGNIPSVPSGINKLQNAATPFVLYPQPATSAVFLQAPPLRYPALIEIHNLQGQLLSTQQIITAGKPISTANLPAGLYLISVTDASGNSAVQKLLIETH